MLDSVVVIGAYPNSENIRDGMVQRIANIDNLLSKYKRVYIEISLKKYWKAKVISYRDATVHKINIFTGFNDIKKIFRQNTIVYIHSLYNYFKSSFFLNANNYKVIDFHGIVPEEQLYQGKILLSFFLQIIEKKMMKKINCAVYVTKKMKEYYNKKYPCSKIDPCFVLPIITNNLDFSALESRMDPIVYKLDNIPEDCIVFIYSGNCQKWQNIEEMLLTIKNKIPRTSKYYTIILTGEIDTMKSIIRKTGCDEIYLNTIVLNVSPDNLGNYYARANYGFILRDNVPLNSVANPTKLIEYMCYGIIPIVKYNDIGDFKSYQYEYYDYLTISVENLKSQKSIINKQIMKKINSERKDEEARLIKLFDNIIHLRQNEQGNLKCNLR
jgi:hypothetical protein